MGKLKQLHIDCEPGKCLATGYESTCYMQSEPDEDPQEPGESTEGSDRDPNIDMDRE